MLPLALAPEAWAGLSAVLGALVGATAGGVVDWVVESSREKKVARAAARMVMGEFNELDCDLADLECGGENQEQYGASVEAWKEYKEVLLSRLDDMSSVRAISQAGLNLTFVGPRLAGVQAEDSEKFRDWLATVRTELAAGYNALAPMADLAPIESPFIYDDYKPTPPARSVGGS